MIHRSTYWIFIGITILAGILCSDKAISQQSKKNITAKNTTEWDQVYEYIQENWSSTIVTNKNLPKPFLASWKTSPTYFYWDNYFINLGALAIQPLSVYATNAVDDAVFLVNTLGFVPNFNDKTGQTRSQTPYLSMMVKDVYNHSKIKDTNWLRQAYNALLKEYKFWTDTSKAAIEDHATGIPHLQHYSHHATKEELVSFYKRVLPGRLGIKDSTLSDDEKAKVAAPYVAEAESMDFTPRFDRRAQDFVAVDLNSNLYLYETNFVWIEKVLKIKSKFRWQVQAEARKKQIQKYLWDTKRGLFMDYDFKNKQFGTIACITSVYPLFAGIATPVQAKRFVENLHLYEYGLSICEKNDSPAPVKFQFDYPASWAAFTVLAVMGLDRYGYKKEAKRIAEKFITVVAKNYFNPIPKQDGHSLYEKYNAVTGEIDGEGYGYGLNKFFGFTAGGYVWCYHYAKQK